MDICRFTMSEFLIFLEKSLQVQICILIKGTELTYVSC